MYLINLEDKKVSTFHFEDYQENLMWRFSDIFWIACAMNLKHRSCVVSSSATCPSICTSNCAASPIRSTTMSDFNDLEFPLAYVHTKKIKYKFNGDHQAQFTCISQ